MVRYYDRSWNPMVGCTPASRGCEHCYARDLMIRSSRRFPNGSTPTWRPWRLDDPRKLDEPSRVAVNPLSDLYHPAFGYEMMSRVWDVMLAESRHDYIVLTRWPQRMAAHLRVWLHTRGLSEVPEHIWVGTSVEDQQHVWRAAMLAGIPAQVRVVACEPLLGPLCLDLDGIGWVIVGPETGAERRPMRDSWAREIWDACTEHAVPVFLTRAVYGRRVEQFPRRHPAVRDA